MVSAFDAALDLAYKGSELSTELFRTPAKALSP